MADVLEQALTTDCCSDIIEMLMKRRRWSIRRIARAIGRPIEYVKRVRTRRQSFQMSDVEALSKACKVQPYRLVFDSFRPEMFPPGLYQLGLREVESHEEFERILRRKPTKKRRPRTKAA
jgi:hypothetical protein